MPAIAAIGGAIGIASGVSAIAAGATGLGLLAAGATVVGGALTVAGAVTGNSSLSKVGGILGLGGSIGGFMGGTLGDPTQVFNGGGFVGGDAGASVSPNINSGSSPTSYGGGTLSTPSFNPASAMGGTPNYVDLSNSSKMIDGTVNSGVLNVGNNASTNVLTKVNDYLTKYDKLTNALGGAADIYQKSQLAQQQINANMALQQNNIAFNAQRFNSGSGTTLPMSAVPNNSGILNAGMNPRAIPMNQPNAVIPGVS